MARILITSALPYINGVKHLGNLVGSQLPSDTYARYLRAKGNEVLLICATDEHGTPAEIAAAEASKPVEEFCKEMWRTQNELARGFNLSFDFFGRSSSKQNRDLTQHFAGKLADNGLIKEVTEKQFFSFKDNRFLPDRYIVGTCPSCNYPRARGDQCENCTKQLNPTELIKPHSAISGTDELELRETKHLHLLQSLMQEKLKTWISTKEDWPILTTSIAKKWLNDGKGLKDRGITRDLAWGIPVKRGKENWPGLDNKVFYVWFDAPIEYISATVEWADSKNLSDEAWERWWRLDKGAKDVKYVQFMAKDNIPFHTLSFPATIMGSGEQWKLVDYIKGFNWLTYEGGKFSTSQKRGVFMDQALEIMPADYWRWWLLSNAPESSDADFTWESFQNGINKDLADVLGNFVSRVTKFSTSKFGNSVPYGGKNSYLEFSTMEKLRTTLASFEDNMDNIEIRKAAADLRAIWVLGNEYLQAAEPWKIYKTDKSSAAMIIRFALNLIGLYSNISRPFIPDTCSQLDQFLKLEPNRDWPTTEYQLEELMKEGQIYQAPENLFEKLSDEKMAELKSRFSGASGTRPLN